VAPSSQSIGFYYLIVGYNTLVTKVVLICERLRHCLLLILKHTSFGIAVRNTFILSVRKQYFSPFTLRAAVLFYYLQLQKAVYEHPGNFNQCC